MSGGVDTVDLRDVAVHYGARRVLHDVTFRAAAGDFVAVLGPNGAGKTTLLRTILGLTAATGSVAVLGQPPRLSWRHIGYVPQRHEFTWDFPLSVADVVLTGRTRQMGWLRGPRRADHEAVAEALHICELVDLRRRPVGQLSGGQRQRVLIARALATRPAALLLDEPFTGVDLPTMERLTDLLAGLSAAGTTVIMTTHDLTQALARAQRICLVNETIVADTTPARLTEPDVWMRTFKVGTASPLLAAVGLVDLGSLQCCEEEVAC